MEASRDWEIGIENWVLPDGNYPDFYAGQKYNFALTFNVLANQDVVAPDKSARLLGDCHYRVFGEVVWRTKAFWVLDFGLKAYSFIPPGEDIRVGQRLGCDIWLGVDPFAYRDEYSKSPSAPPLIYEWTINKIFRVLTPWVKKADQKGNEQFSYDESARSYWEQPSTGTPAPARDSDEGKEFWKPNSVDHFFLCRQSSSEPVRQIVHG